jgi:hypothetical protein
MGSEKASPACVISPVPLVKMSRFEENLHLESIFLLRESAPIPLAASGVRQPAAAAGKQAGKALCHRMMRPAWRFYKLAWARGAGQKNLADARRWRR